MAAAESGDGAGAGAPAGTAGTESGGTSLFFRLVFRLEHEANDGGSVNPGNNLHVSGLSHKIDTRDLEAAFAKIGRVQKASVMYDPHTRESRGFGFVTMETPEEADAAVAALNGSELGGKMMKVEKVHAQLTCCLQARRGRARTPTPGRYYGPPKRGDGELLSSFGLRFLLRFWGRFTLRIERCDSKDAMGNVRGQRCEPLLSAPEIGIRESESYGLVQCRPFPFIDKDLPFMDTALSLPHQANADHPPSRRASVRPAPLRLALCARLRRPRPWASRWRAVRRLSRRGARRLPP
ncbi:hypothetical protein DFH08DRAFT_693286 [Mycena albidolilacea]|uniref:RRM domain-containing protein n=1 Tax=Mycena albidolilacea TaxID=1033008 RepID=A0AAD7A8A1_9AGAR|nr:hypothetical protein DFH08DRAFT_693286 [Mycena albidolilacea]